MPIWRILPVTLGAALILWSLRPGMRFYPRAMGIGSKDRTVPRWLGRLWFILFGSWLITVNLGSSERFNRTLSASYAIAVGVIFLGVGIWSRWMPDWSKQNRDRAWLGRIIALVLGTTFLFAGLRELRH